MKISFTFIVLTTLCLTCIQGQNIINLGVHQVIKTLCRLLTFVDSKLVDQIRNHDFTSEDESLKKYVFCIHRRLQVIDKDGNIDKEKVMTFLPPEMDISKFSDAIDKCKNQNGTSQYDKFYKTFKCYYLKYPNDYDFL